MLDLRRALSVENLEKMAAEQFVRPPHHAMDTDSFGPSDCHGKAAIGGFSSNSPK
jgi:hypothetical protein